jgi:hypothetical protein
MGMKPNRRDVRLIDRALRRFSRDNAGLREAERTLLAAEEALRRRLAGPHWRAYLMVNKYADVVHGALIDRVIRVAFRQGYRRAAADARIR